jgi:hypothetical protein
MYKILAVQEALATKYGYKPLPLDLSQKYRDYFTQYIPSFLNVEGGGTLYTPKGVILCSLYKRIVIGDYGAFVEIDPNMINKPAMMIKPGEEYRRDTKGRFNNVKYEWYTINDGSNIKIYYQKRTVEYADYKPDMYYISVYEVKS